MYLSPITFFSPFCLLATTTTLLLLHNTGYLSHLNVFIMLQTGSDEEASAVCSQMSQIKKIHCYIITISSNFLTLLLATSFTFSNVSVIVALNNKFCLIFGRVLKIIFNCWIGERKICYVQIRDSHTTTGM